MFRANESPLNIRMGDSRFTRARYTLSDPAAVLISITRPSDGWKWGETFEWSR